MPLIDLRRRREIQRVEADLCIIGAGAAGLAIASQFIGRSESVALLESGGMTLEADTQDLYQGSVVGQAHAPLAQGRLRYFGGTTNHWTAHVRPLSRLDFQAREWVAHSGWPFGREVLDPYYEQARELLGLPRSSFDASAWKGENHGALAFSPDRIEMRVRQEVHESKRRFGPRFRSEIERSTNVTAYLHADVLRIQLAEARNHVTGLEIGTLDGRRFEARARQYVVATGGIENARILLLSSIGSNSGRGTNLVGAFFSNHVEGWAGYIQPSDRMITASLYQAAPHDSGTTRPFLAVSQELQQRERLLDCWIQPTPGLGMKSLRTGIARESIPLRINALRSPITNADVARFAAEVDHGKPLPLGRRGVPRPIPVRVIAETAPNPDSRVRLGEQVDALGQRRVVLDWRLTEQDSRSTLRTLRILAREVGAAGIGRLRILYPSAGFPSIRTVASHHHMGTTRMHVDPSQGVVDPNCRMHGVDNLHVAGSSVFPTYGTANPTYTILALAFRLSERLKEELQS